MKDLHPSEAELNEFVEGAMGPAAARRIEAHLGSCDDCREEVRSLRNLLNELHGLPRRIRPPRDLLPAVLREVAAAGVPTPAARRRVRVLGGPLPAAAVLLLALLGVGAWLIDRRTEEPVAVRPPTAVPAGLVEVAADYELAIAELTATLDQRGSDLDPATTRLVDENVRLIDRAIGETRAALAVDPGNAFLRQLFVASYERKLDLLRRAARSAET